MMSGLSKDSFRYYFKLKDWIPTNLSLVQAFRCIQTEERERISKFHFKEDFKAALIGRLLLRKIVNQRFDLNNREIKLIRNEHGRPILACDESTDDQIFNQTGGDDYSLAHLSDAVDSLKFDFNISHQGDYCVAVGENVRQIGVDVMKIEKRSNRTLDDYFDLMRRKFTKGEWSFINSGRSDCERLKRFMRLWTLKESFVKAEGCGLTIDLQKIDFNCRTDHLVTNRITCDTVLKFDNKLQTNWTFVEYLLDDDYCVAIAINKPQSNHSDHRLLDEMKFDQLVDQLDALDEDVDMNSLWDLYSKRQSRGN